jgi:hypothetical protein
MHMVVVMVMVIAVGCGENVGEVVQGDTATTIAAVDN